MTETDGTQGPPSAEPPPRSPDQGPVQLPQALIVGIAIVLTGLFVLNIVADIFVKGYSGYPTTALLGILVGSVLGIERFLRIGR